MTALRWPRKVRIAGLVVPVRYVRVVSSSDDVPVAGTFCRTTQRIEIEKTTNDHVRYMLLCHEMLHAWYWVHVKRPDKTRLTEERAVSLMAGAMAAIWLDNPPVRRLAEQLGKRRPKAK